MQFDVIVIGAGGAGMMCAAQAGKRGRRVLLIDHVKEIGERIRISGGGRCNFTNRHAGPENYISQNPDFCRSALARFSQWDFIKMVEQHRIQYHERDHGQYFCKNSAQDIIAMLKAECAKGKVRWANPCMVQQISRIENQEDNFRFVVATDQGTYKCHSLVIATGGLSIPKIGATPFGYKIAEQFKLRIVPPKPALVPLALSPETLKLLNPISGVSFNANTYFGGKNETRRMRFREDVLVTHRGLSGPAILQISSYWQAQDYKEKLVDGKQPIEIDLLPGVDVLEWLESHRRSKMLFQNLLAERLPRRFAQEWCALFGWQKPLNEFSNRELASLAQALKHWSLMPSGTLGYAKAEVTLGGVDTNELSSKTMETKKFPGLYFIGEVVDVTGWLGGYNFQWAWSSGWVAGSCV
jgi:predicted Rossmann fold flavoprotein